jgi:hypothetical protein
MSFTHCPVGQLKRTDLAPILFLLTIGMGIILISTLFPPWVSSNNNLGFHFILTGPTYIEYRDQNGKPVRPENREQAIKQTIPYGKINGIQLLLEWIMISLLTAGTILLLQEHKGQQREKS